MRRTSNLITTLSWLAVSSVAGCNNSTTANEVGRIGWDFDYRDWTKPLCGACADLGQSACESSSACAWDGAGCGEAVPCREPQPRGCDNQPPAAAGPAFPEVVTVQVVIFDSDRNRTVLDREVECIDGEGDDAYVLRSLSRKLLHVTMTAHDPDGAPFFVTPATQDLDLSEMGEHRYALRAGVADVYFGVEYPGTGLVCPSADVARLRTTIRDPSDGAELRAVTQAPACELNPLSGELVSQQIYVRGIPVAPTAAGGAFIPQTLEIEVQAQDSGGATLYCGTSSRPVAPGSNDDHSAVALAAGACP